MEEIKLLLMISHSYILKILTVKDVMSSTFSNSSQHITGKTMEEHFLGPLWRN